MKVNRSVVAVVFVLIFAGMEGAWSQIGPNSYRTPAYIQFTSNSFAEFDEESNAVITVLRTGEYREPVSVSFTTRDGSATAGIDYAFTSGTLLIPGGVGMVEFNVPILLDELPKEPRTVELILSNPGPNGIILQETAVLEIVDRVIAGASLELPRLTISQSENGGVIISWPAGEAEHLLEKTHDLFGGDWREVTAGPTLNSGLFKVIELINSGEPCFYRLRVRN
jgi:hypothetical protein